MNQNILMRLLETLPWMLASGIDLLQALTLIAREQRKWASRAVLNHLCQSIQQGQSFSFALNAQLRVPQAVYICIRTGEVSGHLPECLGHAYAWLRAQSTFKRSLTSQCFYPALLLTVLVCCFVLAFSFIMPSFEQLYHQFQAPLPQATQSLMRAYHTLVDHGPQWVLVLLLGILTSTLAIRTSHRARLIAETVLIHSPWLGTLLRLALTQRFCLLLGILLKAGVPLSEALHLLSEHMPLKTYRALFRQASRDLSQGQTLAVALGNSVYFDPALIRLLALGSESGTLDNVLNQLAKHYAERLKARQKHFKEIIQPILMLCLGVLIGAWVLLLYYPLIQLGSLIG